METKLVLNVDDHWPRETCGGKAAVLAMLRREGFQVPNGCVLTNSGAEALAELPGELVRTQVDRLLAFEIARLEEQCAGDGGLGGLGKSLPGVLLACRSSCACEDGTDHSFAGMFETVLNVAPADAVLTVAKVAATSREALEGSVAVYGTTESVTAGVAILIQEMVDCEWSGVSFSIDPVSFQDVVVVEGVEGLCDKLTAGEVTPERFRVDGGGRVTRVNTTASSSAAFAAAAAEDTPGWVTEVAATTRAIAIVFGQPVDCEWAVHPCKGVIVLQARPITTITTASTIERPLEDIPRQFHFWHGGIAPVWGRELAARSYMQHGFGGIQAFHVMADAMLFVKAGECYMEGWLSELDKVVASRMAKKLVAVADGENGEKIGKRIGKTIGGGLRKLLDDASDVVGRQADFYMAYSAVDVGMLDGGASLWCHFWKMCHHFLQNYHLYLITEAFFADVFTSTLLGDDDVLGEAGVLLRPFKPDLFEQEQAAFLELSSAKNAKTSEQINQKTTLPDDVLLAHAHKFPFVAYNCFSLQQVLERLHTALDQVDQVKVDQMDVDDGGGGRDQTEQAAAATSNDMATHFADLRATQEDILARRPELRMPSSLIQELSLCRMSVKNGWTGSHLYLIPVFAEISLRTGVSVKELHSYYLLGDIRSLLVDGVRVSEDRKREREKGILFRCPVKKEKQEQQQEQEQQDSNLDPDPDLDLSFDSPTSIRFDEGGESAVLFDGVVKVKSLGLRGSVASAGEVTGRARIVGTNDGRKYIIEEGDIIVTIMAQPQQYSMLKACCGIVTDEGGILSHAAIVSRELGIPCIVGVTGATKMIEEGATITIVAEGPDRGTIRVVE